MLRLRIMLRVWGLMVLAGLMGLSAVQGQTGRCDDTVPLIEQYAGARVVTDTPNNVRETPSVDGELQGQIPPEGVFVVAGEPVCAEGYTWYEIYYQPEDGDAIQGWTAAAPADSAEVWIAPVSDDDAPLVPGIVRYREDEYIPQIENATPVIGDVVRVSIVPEGDSLNMRDEPDTSAAVIAELLHSAVLDVLAGPVESDGYRWWQLRTDGGTVGWVSDTFRPEYGYTYYSTLVPRCPYADTAGNRLLTFARMDTFLNGEIQPRGSDRTSILTMAPDGSQRCRIAFAARGSGLSEPAWTPDGHIVYIYEINNQSIGGAYNGDTYIYQLAADGIQQTLLAPGRQYYWNLSVSPDGSGVFYSFWGNPDSIWRVGFTERDNARLFTGSVNNPFHLVDGRLYFRGGIEGVTYDPGSDYQNNIVWLDTDTLAVFSIDGTADNFIAIPGSNDILYYAEADETGNRPLMRFVAAENQSVELSFNRDHRSNLIGLMPDQTHYLRIGWNRLNPDESPGEYEYAYFLEDVGTGNITQVTGYEYEARARSSANISPDGRYLSTDTGVFNLETGEFTPLDNAGQRGIWRPLRTGD